jgi:hypothetical protein
MTSAVYPVEAFSRSIAKGAAIKGDLSCRACVGYGS